MSFRLKKQTSKNVADTTSKHPVLIPKLLIGKHGKGRFNTFIYLHRNEVCFYVTENGFLELFVLLIYSVFLDLTYIYTSFNLRTSTQEMSAKILKWDPKF